jgi:hypothetical protein
MFAEADGRGCSRIGVDQALQPAASEHDAKAGNHDATLSIATAIAVPVATPALKQSAPNKQSSHSNQ